MYFLILTFFVVNIEKELINKITKKSTKLALLNVNNESIKVEGNMKKRALNSLNSLLLSSKSKK